MALENPDIIEFELVEDVYTVKRNKSGVQLIIDGKVVHPNITSVKVNADDGSLNILGRGLGKINAEKSGDHVMLSEKFQGWYPPGQVKHAHNLEEFDTMKSSGLVVGKFSAEWCGPCKAVAPKIDRLSLQYPDVTFIHCDEAECKALFQREKIEAFPTFHMYEDGNRVDEKMVRGGDADAVERAIVAMGAQKVEMNTTEEIVEETVVLTCQRDQFKIEKSSAGISLSINGEVVAPAPNCPHIEIHGNQVSFGRGGGEVYTAGGLNIEELSSQISAMFPTELIHIQSATEFDEQVSSGITIATFCGKAIAPFMHELSNKLKDKVKFLHIDADKCKALSQREGLQAIPTFHFFVDGEKQADKKLVGRGASQDALIKNIIDLGINESLLQ